ncbi:MAG: hypothetical protein V3V08_05045 [Nannocystaceae bacterium]
MAKDSKFGTFGGVFTPSVLTILGVIMYMRLPMVVGSAGWVGAVGIIVVAHVISVTTGLSIASIATDKSVGAGGPYYIVSRSLGLPIGGTLGLALFVGLGFSISLYVIGFAESIIPILGFSVDMNSIRICGTITVVALTAITLISTSLAIKAQYLILVLIAVSLLAIFGGALQMSVVEASGEPLPDVDMAVLFGIFFPAVTGFTAGVNMSGDLRSPHRSIPSGTMAAIGVGLVVYLALAIVLMTRVDAEVLATHPDILLEIALNRWLVMAGIWGATLSSALGSILGAPRILQAVSADGITPKIFARGSGKNNEPRNALIVAFMLGEAGVLIGELNVIARVVSMVFLATYGFLNISCFIESWASPDFRPQFKIPKTVSLAGALTCLVVMIQLDLAAMAGATVLMSGLYLWLQQRQLRLDAGDTWEGIWATLVRAGLHRLSHTQAQKRNWRPNMLLFSPPQSEMRDALLRLSNSLISGRGMVTDFGLAPKPGRRRSGKQSAEERPVGLFQRDLSGPRLYGEMEAACRYYGFSGVEPNTAIIDWEIGASDRPGFPDLLDRISGLDLNVLLYARDPAVEPGAGQRIDVWWRQGEGSLSLSLSLLRFMQSSDSWRSAKLHVMLLTPDLAHSDLLRSAAARMIRDARLVADVRVVHEESTERDCFEQLIARDSAEADLTITGLPRGGEERLLRMEALVGSQRRVLFVRASSFFVDPLRATPAVVAEDVASTPLSIEDLSLPAELALHAPVGAFVERCRALAEMLHEGWVVPACSGAVGLLTELRGVAEIHFSQLEKGLRGSNPAKRRKALNRTQSAFLHAARRVLHQYHQQVLVDQAQLLSGRTEGFFEDLDGGALPVEELIVETELPRLEPVGGDSWVSRRLKRRRRMQAWFGGTAPSFAVPLRRCVLYHRERAVGKLAQRSLRAFEIDSYRLLLRVGKLLNDVDSTPLALVDDLDAAQDGTFERAKTRLIGQLDAFTAEQRARAESERGRLQRAVRELGQTFADDLGRIDVERRARRRGRLPSDAAGLRDGIAAAPERWRRYAGLLVGRARLGLRMMEIQHRLVAAASKLKQTLAVELKGGTMPVCQRLRDDLRSALDRVRAEERCELPGAYEFGARFDGKRIVDSLIQQAADWSSELPETFETLSDASIVRIEEGKIDDLELVEISVRRLFQHLLETEFVEVLSEQLVKIPDLEGRAVGTAADVIRLVTYNLAEFAEGGEDVENGGFQIQLEPVLENGIERMEAEIEQLGGVLPRLATLIDRRLDAVLEGSHVYGLGQADEGFNQQILRQQGRALGAIKAFGERLGVGVRDASVSLWYRRSAGVLLARRLRSSERTSSIVDTMIGFVDANTPRPEVLNTIPFFYRQLFIRKSLVNETFWVGRQEQLAQARQAIAHFRRGVGGMILVTGEHNSGKSALTRRVLGGPLARQPVYRVLPPPAGSVDPADLLRAVAVSTESLGASGLRLDSMLARLPEGAVVVIEDLELWWERSAVGWANIDTILEMVRRHGRRLLFVAEINCHALAFIRRFRPLADAALSVLECPPLPAKALAEIVMLRNDSTGLKLRLRERKEHELSVWGVARLFSRHFDHSLGNVGAALRGWIAHIDHVDDENLHVRMPIVVDRSPLDDLGGEWTAVLVQFALHKRLSQTRLQRLAGSHPVAVHVEALRRAGLIVGDHRGVLELNRHVDHLVVDRLRRRRLLP